MNLSEVRVGREGEIYTSDPPSDQPLSRIGGVWEGDDARYVAAYMPRNTVFVDQGWMYKIQTSVGRAYTLFAFFDGCGYQVNLMTPRLVGFPAGRIDLSSGPGRPSLEDAYARSVLWAAGMDLALAAGSTVVSYINDLYPGMRVVT
ncbi:hypothetical protein [Herbidospora yilanensis]|uniref:hypothetical protein n=1 Tax=Herbidospora yilanensis TaxID=354426 RepID=UPI0007867408|nr:hypothetical protein [Herbidospora yilanensis]